MKNTAEFQGVVKHHQQHFLGITGDDDFGHTLRVEAMVRPGWLDVRARGAERPTLVGHVVRVEGDMKEDGHIVARTVEDMGVFV